MNANLISSASLFPSFIPSVSHQVLVRDMKAARFAEGATEELSKPLYRPTDKAPKLELP
jgi:hypothetical protein